MTLVLLIIGIIATVVGIFACFFRGEFFEDWPKGVKAAILVVGILLIFLSQSVYVVKTNHTGVSVTLGQVNENPVKPGIGFKKPFVETIHDFDNRQNTTTIADKCWSETKDRTVIYYENVSISYQIPAEGVVWLYNNVEDTDNLLGTDIVSSAVKASSVKFGDADATNRGLIEPEVTKALQKLADEKYGAGRVIVVSTIVGNADFLDEYNQALEQKRLAQIEKDKQDIENEKAIAKANNDKEVAAINTEKDYNAKVQAAKAEADALYELAQKQAEANELLANSLTDPILRQQFLDKWDGKFPNYVGGESGSFIFNMLEDAEQQQSSTDTSAENAESSK